MFYQFPRYIPIRITYIITRSNGTRNDAHIKYAYVRSRRFVWFLFLRKNASAKNRSIRPTWIGNNKRGAFRRQNAGRRAEPLARAEVGRSVRKPKYGPPPSSRNNDRPKKYRGGLKIADYFTRGKFCSGFFRIYSLRSSTLCI